MRRSYDRKRQLSEANAVARNGLLSAMVQALNSIAVEREVDVADVITHSSDARSNLMEKEHMDANEAWAVIWSEAIRGVAGLEEPCP